MTVGPVPDVRGALTGAAHALGLTLDTAQVDQLLAYLELLQRWNAVYNLTSVRDPAAMVTQHLADCLAVVGPLQRVIGDRRTVLDVGSGGGLPAVVIAIALPTLRVTSVDAVGKKAAFVRQVAAELQLGGLTALHARVEQLPPASFDLVTARAFSSLGEFVRLSEPLLAPQGCWMAMKGRVPHDEFPGVDPGIEVFHVEQLDVPRLAGERCLVWMRRRAESAEADSL